MQKYSNNTGVGLLMAGWLAHDTYSNGQEEHPGKLLISATALLKPTRQLLLGNRIPVEDRRVDVMERAKSRAGQALHDSVERTWVEHGHEVLEALGYPKGVIKRLQINPVEGALGQSGMLPIFFEKRAYRDIKVNGVTFTISGKFDAVVDGELNDIKATSVFTWKNNTKDEDYAMQMGVYRWLNPKIISSSQGRIQHYFWDWKGFEAAIQKNYPPQQIVEKVLNLPELVQVESFISGRLSQLMRYDQVAEEDLPECTPDELWMSNPVYKYYATAEAAAKGGRSTKNFDDLSEASLHAAKAGKGVVITVEGKPKACAYCAGAPLCTQRLKYGED